MTAAPITIPAVAVTQADGTAIKAAIAAGPTDRQRCKKNPAHSGIRDGDLENAIIIHEYTHGISSRLTGGAGNSCLGGNEQAGEGWSDFARDHAADGPGARRPGGARAAMGPYALFQPDRHGNGIRPRPYSRDMEHPAVHLRQHQDQRLAQRHVAGAPARPRPRLGGRAVGHGLGPDRQVRLQPATSTAAWNTGGNNRALQYVIDGLKLQGCNPGLVVSARGDHRRRRGAATTAAPTRARCGRRSLAAASATAPSRARRTATTTTEAFDTHPELPARASTNVPAGPALTTIAAGSPYPLEVHGRQRLHAGWTSPPSTTRTRARSTARR